MTLRRLAIGLAAAATIAVGGTSTAAASTLSDFLPPEIVALIPSASADSVAPLLPPVLAPPAAPAPPAPPAQPAPPAAPAQPAPPAAAPQPAPSQVYYRNCTAARNAGAAPIYRGQAGYAAHLDRDNDGIACEN